MRADRLALLTFALGACACHGADLVLGDGNAKGSPATDAAVDAAPNGAGMDAAPNGAVVPDFATPQLIQELAQGEGPDDDPSLSADRALLCFNSKRDGGLGHEDIWCATRAPNALRWDAPAALQTVNSEARETGVALSADGLSLWFSSDRKGGAGGLDVYVARRSERTADFGSPLHVSELSSERDDLVSSVDEAGRRLVMARRDDDDDDYDVLISQRKDPEQPWQAPEPLDAINSDDEESDGFLIGAGLSLLFTRDGDLMLATRSSASQPFDRGKPLSTLNSKEDDRDAWSDSQLRYVVFSSDRDGEHRLYEAQR